MGRTLINIELIVKHFKGNIMKYGEKTIMSYFTIVQSPNYEFLGSFFIIFTYSLSFKP